MADEIYSKPGVPLHHRTNLSEGQYAPTEDFVSLDAKPAKNSSSGEVMVVNASNDHGENPPNHHMPEATILVRRQRLSIEETSPEESRQKRRRTEPAREVTCCPCSIESTCKSNLCPCALKKQLCTRCDPGTKKRCQNSTVLKDRVKYTPNGIVTLPHPYGGKLSKKKAEEASKAKATEEDNRPHDDIRNHFTPRHDSNAVNTAAVDPSDETQNAEAETDSNDQSALAGHDDSQEEISDADDTSYSDHSATADVSDAEEEHNLKRGTLTNCGEIDCTEATSLIVDNIAHGCRGNVPPDVFYGPEQDPSHGSCCINQFSVLQRRGKAGDVDFRLRMRNGETGQETEVENDKGTAAYAEEEVEAEEEDSREKTGKDSSSEESGDDGEEDGTRGIEGIVPPRKEPTEDEIMAIFGQLAQKDYELQSPSWADRKLISVYGDTIHQNDGTHLHGQLSAVDDRYYQQLHARVVKNPSGFYEVYRNGTGARFLNVLTTEFKNVREGKMNAERALIFPACILTRKRGCSRSADIKRLITTRLDLWEKGDILSLVIAVEVEGQSGRLGGRPMGENGIGESEARRFAATLQSGNIRKAVREVTDRGQGGLYKPTDLDSKTGEPVIDVLRTKFPSPVTPAEGDPLVFQKPPDFEEENVDAFVYVDADHIESRSSKLHGAAGPSGVDAIMLKAWLTRHGAASDALRVEMAEWASWLGCSNPEYAKIRALNHVRLLAVDKEPGVRPLGCGEIWMRLISGTILDQCKERARDACNNVQLCAGLQAGIEGATHAMLDVFPELAGWLNMQKAATNSETEKGDGEDETDGDGVDDSVMDGSRKIEEPMADASTEEASTEPPPPPPFPEYPIQPDTENSHYIPGSGYGLLLVDARNAFNELNRYNMLWEVYHRCPPLAKIAFNRYRHHSLCFMRNEMGEDPTVIACKEGITQGCCLSMVCYGIALMPLAEWLRTEVPGALQPWYADDLSGIGTATDNATVLQLLKEKGPYVGYYPEPDKSHYVCMPQDEEAAKAAFEAAGIPDLNYGRSRRYLGGVYGDAAPRRKSGSRRKWNSGYIAWKSSANVPTHNPRRLMLRLCCPFRMNGHIYRELCRTWDPFLLRLKLPLERNLSHLSLASPHRNYLESCDTCSHIV